MPQGNKSGSGGNAVCVRSFVAAGKVERGEPAGEGQPDSCKVESSHLLSRAVDSVTAWPYESDVSLLYRYVFSTLPFFHESVFHEE